MTSPAVLFFKNHWSDANPKDDEDSTVGAGLLANGFYNITHILPEQPPSRPRPLPQLNLHRPLDLHPTNDF
jgi:hypothetical protein